MTLIVGLLAAAGGAFATRRGDQVERALGAPIPRRIVPRTSVATDFRECTTPDVARDSQPATCASASGDDDARRRAAKAVAGRDTTAAGYHARALVELLWGGSAGNAVDTSISLLERLAEARPSAAVLTDLSAAYLVRLERRGAARDLIAAIEAASRATELDSMAAAASWNLAVALARLDLNQMAGIAWAAYLRHERDSLWIAEARTRESMLRRPAVAAPLMSEPSAVVREWAAHHRQRAREIGMDEWLPAWGRALAAGDYAVANVALRAVHSLAGGVNDGDSTLHTAIETIDRSNPVRRQRLARAHVAYGVAQRAFLRSDFPASIPRLDSILADRSLPEYLRLWATSGRAATAVNTADAARTPVLLHHVLNTPGSRKFPSVRGRAHWALGTIAARDGRYGDAIAHFRHARSEYGRARELANYDITFLMSGESQLRIGDEEGLEDLRHALHGLQLIEPTSWLHNSLYILARYAEGEGFPRAARWIAEEDVRVASSLDTARYDRSLYLVESRLGLARVVQPRPDSVNFALGDSPQLLSTIRNARMREFIGQQLAVVQARGLVRTQPRMAADLLAGPVAFNRRVNRLRLLPALLLRASAFERLGRADSAASDLEEAASLLAVDRTAVSGEWHRATVLAEARAILDRLVFANAEHAERSLAYLERGRRAFGEIVAGKVELRMPLGSVALTHALVADTLLSWTVSASGAKITRARIDRHALLSAIIGARTALEHRDDRRALPALERLYDVLVAPVSAHLPEGAMLVVAGDGPLGAIPWAALRDRSRGRWLIEKHTLVSSSGMRDGIVSFDSSNPPRKGYALVVSEPSGGPTLVASAREADSVAAALTVTRSLSGPAATPSAVMRAITGANLVHFAGHAVSDALHPARSHLVLSAEGGKDRLEAAELERLDLRGVRLIVLAACESMANDQGASAYRGLADALRAAGAGGVVGSIWRVDDNLTAELMARFHRVFARSQDGASALAMAQRDMIATRDARLALPSAWAGFQYAGSWTIPTVARTVTNRSE